MFVYACFRLGSHSGWHPAQSAAVGSDTRRSGGQVIRLSRANRAAGRSGTGGGRKSKVSGQRGSGSAVAERHGSRSPRRWLSAQDRSSEDPARGLIADHEEGAKRGHPCTSYSAGSSCATCGARASGECDRSAGYGACMVGATITEFAGAVRATLLLALLGAACDVR